MDLTKIKNIGPSSIENILRKRVYQNSYFLAYCFSLDEKSIIKTIALDVNTIGVTVGSNTIPTKFFCLLVKLLHINPQLQSVIYYIKQPHFKYLTALGLFYIRFAFYSSCPEFIVETLKEFVKDCRQVEITNENGKTENWTLSDLSRKLLEDKQFLNLSLPPFSLNPLKKFHNEDVITMEKPLRQTFYKHDIEDTNYMEVTDPKILIQAYKYNSFDTSRSYEIFHQNALRKYLGQKPLNLSTEPDRLKIESEQKNIWKQFLHDLCME